MIKGLFKRNDSGRIKSFELTGHANAGEYGSDIVCAAVSALAIGLTNSLSVLTGKTPFIQETNEIEGGYLYVEISKAFSEEQLKISQVILESLLISLTGIAEEYAEYIQIND